MEEASQKTNESGRRKQSSVAKDELMVHDAVNLWNESRSLRRKSEELRLMAKEAQQRAKTTLERVSQRKRVE